jgi:hypothetical protein
MAKGRIRSRMELREQYEAAEARERDARKDGDEGDEDEDVGELDEEAAEEEAEGDEEAAPAKKKPVKKKAPAKPRKKVVKAVRKRVVWVVYDNSNKQVGKFDYNKKDEAIARAEHLKAEKKQTYFVQPLKEEIPE